MKKIKEVKSAVYGLTTYYVVSYTDGTVEIKYHLTKQMEAKLRDN